MGNLTCFLDSRHMVSYYLPIHFMALNATLKKIIGGGGGHMNFKLSSWLVPARKSLINQSLFIRSLPKSNQLAFLIV